MGIMKLQGNMMWTLCLFISGHGVNKIFLNLKPQIHQFFLLFQNMKSYNGFLDM
jgi:hypothetical protein